MFPPEKRSHRVFISFFPQINECFVSIISISLTYSAIEPFYSFMSKATFFNLYARSDLQQSNLFAPDKCFFLIRIKSFKFKYP